MHITAETSLQKLLCMLPKSRGHCVSHNKLFILFETLETYKSVHCTTDTTLFAPTFG